MNAPKPTFSIVTATYNAAQVLPQLIASLQAQTDQDFEWIVADGASTDDTLALIEAAMGTIGRGITVDSRPDFGIYDALNRGVKLASGEYYLVMGADDVLAPDAVENYRNACAESGADFVTAHSEASAATNNRFRNPKYEWLYGPFAHVYGHAVSLAIKRSLHQRFGFYSRLFPIAADQMFILQAIHVGARVEKKSFIAGRFESKDGSSGQNILGTLLEGFHVQLRFGHTLWLQTLILLLRIFKNRKRVEFTKP